MLQKGVTCIISLLQDVRKWILLNLIVLLLLIIIFIFLTLCRVSLKNSWIFNLNVYFKYAWHMSSQKFHWKLRYIIFYWGSRVENIFISLSFFIKNMIINKCLAIYIYICLKTRLISRVECSRAAWPNLHEHFFEDFWTKIYHKDCVLFRFKYNVFCFLIANKYFWESNSIWHQISLQIIATKPNM